MREKNNNLRIYKTMYIELLSFELQLNNTQTFFKKKTSVDIAIALKSNFPGNYMPYMYLNNLEHHKAFLLCRHLSKKSFFDDMLDNVVTYALFVSSAECVFIHAGGNNVVLIFMLPLHPKLLSWQGRHSPCCHKLYTMPGDKCVRLQPPKIKS